MRYLINLIIPVVRTLLYVKICTNNQANLLHKGLPKAKSMYIMELATVGKYANPCVGLHFFPIRISSILGLPYQFQTTDIVLLNFLAHVKLQA